MPLEIFTPNEIRAVAAKNPLRQYPGLNKGKSRLLPFAQPRICTERRFPEGAKFFVVGNCYGRNLEKALAKAGRSFLSSPSDLDLPGTAKQQYNRYNIFNLDVSTNEVTWAIDPNAQPVDDALIQVGEEWVDMQIHWSFAHPQEQARAFRKVYNTSYVGIAEADVVILSSSGTEQWFDRQTGIYMNGAPTAKMGTLYPDRFEFHRLDAEASAQSLRRAIDVVLENTKVSPIILVTVSPVQQPLVYGKNDALIEQFLAKSYLRAAAEQVCREYDQVEYLPSLEFALLSDFQYAYSAKSFNHTSQGLANRVVAEMLLRYEGETPGYQALNAIGQAEALIIAGEYEQAVAAVRSALEAGATLSFDLDFQYTQALVKAGYAKEAAAWLIDRMDTATDQDKKSIFRQATNLVKAHGGRADIERLLAHAEGMDIDEEALQALQTASEIRTVAPQSFSRDMRVSDITSALKAGRYDEVRTRCEEILQDPESPQAIVEHVLPPLVRSLMLTGGHMRAIEHIYNIVSRQEVPDQRWLGTLIKIATSHGELPIIENVIALSARFPNGETMLAALERRRALLIKQGVNGLGRE